MLLLAMTMILRSNDDRIVAINKTDASESASAAESGLNRVRAFLNRYRVLAISNKSAWSDSLANISESCNAGTMSTDLAALEPIGSDWPDVDPSDASKGEFRLYDYTYAVDTSGTANAPLGTGTLKMQGRVNNGDAVSQIELKIPIYPVKEQAAGLWVKSSISGNSKVEADVLAPCASTVSVSPQSGYALLRTNLTMPPVPSPSSVKVLSSIANKTLPEAGDTPNATTGAYHYSVPTISAPFEVTEGKKVRIWVSGNINLSSIPVVHYCGNDITCGPFDVQVYGTGGTGSTITLNQGTSLCDVFFHAPNYEVKVVETVPAPVVTPIDCKGETPTTTERNTGVFWVNSWTDTSSSSDPILNSPRANWQMAPIAPPPQMGPVSGWEPTQAQP
ncbi:MAG: hypothetical protein ACFCU8_11970 [Thermosynechococcaceae cyanobacterium]